MKIKNGFTLVELMVVVAIIGLLSAVAVPNFKKYQAKAKSSEAKLQLAAIYMSEQSFSMDYNSYATCLNHMGFDPSRESGSRYYLVGFINGSGAVNGTARSGGATASCTDGDALIAAGAAPSAGASARAYAAGKAINGVVANSDAFIPGTALNVNTFTAGAGGVISTDTLAQTAATCDLWTINHNKVVSQVRVGY